MRPLSGAEVEALVRDQVVGDRRPRRRWWQQIQVASGGNALYATQLAGAAAAAGELPAAVPDGLDAMCRARVAAASPAARELLDAAAVLGMDVPARPAGRDPRRRARRRRAPRSPRCARAGLLATDDEHDRVRFTHGVIRQVIYDDLTADPPPPPARAQRRRARGRGRARARSPRGARPPPRAGPPAGERRRARPRRSRRPGRHAARQGALEVSRRLLEHAVAARRRRPAGQHRDRPRHGGGGRGRHGGGEADRGGRRCRAGRGPMGPRRRCRGRPVAAGRLARAPATPCALAADIEEALAHLDPDDLSRRGPAPVVARPTCS